MENSSCKVVSNLLVFTDRALTITAVIHLHPKNKTLLYITLHTVVLTGYCILFVIYTNVIYNKGICDNYTIMSDITIVGE